MDISFALNNSHANKLHGILETMEPCYIVMRIFVA